jgi:hypothetical protein
LVGTGTLSSIAYADALTNAHREKLTPDDIIRHLVFSRCSGQDRFQNAVVT